ncbi:zinc ABC transporter substrate-binding protein [Haloferax sp. MBLA0076]|uniref:Zinc ABC transporter substrate-binding protein n=1 Tax=Haloferax litoreum TaxID=2666140 RepID=A0A6A8GKP2_9EURY|nr:MULTISPECIES: metal ABC transporter substrate-binding protein [Haloferax]KAB1190000.1 zinc ABC transporter substrate-binding protein [Haloferax sp. CBA1148]MRX23773.1 zinc ABC transporter substrate-binding protein [Haloferax litoreum]
MRRQNRRDFLAAVSGATTAALAGCLGSGTSGQSAAPDETQATASFFVFGDVTSHVAGEAASAETLVPLGQHGHGWEPGPDVQGRILESTVFVHGMRDFQPWADDIVASLEADGSDVVSVDISADVSLHEVGDDGHAHDDDDEDAHHDEDNHEDDSSGDDHHDDTVTDSHEEHDTGSVDPHFWMDPQRVATATGTVRDALQAVDAENTDAYADNAERYLTALADLDAAFEEGLESRERDVILVAGHDAYGYLADRYDFDVVALTGLSPDDEPSPRDIERAQATIEEHGIRHVLADPLESDRAATQLVAETDAEAVLPLTSIPGLTQEWVEQDWGYVDIVREINLPSLRTALDAR